MDNEPEPRKIAVLVGGPFDGIALDPCPDGEVNEVILRRAGYLPVPGDAAYRLDVAASLNVPRLIRGFTAGVRLVVFWYVAESELAGRVRAQDGELRLRSQEVDRLLGDVQRLRAAVRKKDEKCRKCRERRAKRKGER